MPFRRKPPKWAATVGGRLATRSAKRQVRLIVTRRVLKQTPSEQTRTAADLKRPSRAVLNGCFRRSIGATANERLTSPLIRLQPRRFAHSQSGRAIPWSRSGSARPQSRAFEERILGVETQRQWSDLAIARTTPTLFGLFSLVTLWAANPKIAGSLRPRSAACEASFSDATAAVRRLFWSAPNYQCPGMTRMAWKFQPPSGID